ncbi:VanZ family protein [Polaromonas sp.]|uniref:VanZ family protein n=1 Tax=Polaromonas sp. TaxID=1869339 RepID=UPI0017EF6FA9|nr:VanZ family protein [Polaromonas sp.]NMM08288.1 VanZ family protein [Polaromonas sp.]
MSRRFAWFLVLLQVPILIVGTQMPGAWRSAAETSVHAPFPLSSLAHLVLFTSIALVLSMRPIAWPAGRVVLLTLGLALLTEGLQFFAVDRHPRLMDVGIDMTGALLGLVCGCRLKASSLIEMTRRQQDYEA